MRKVALQDLEPGMRLARDVYLDDGRILMLKGFTIKPRYIQKLSVYKIPFVHVDDDIQEVDIVSEEHVYEEAFQAVRNIMETVRNGGAIDVAATRAVVDDIVTAIMNDESVFLTLTGIRDIDNYTFLHCIDVCIYSVITGKHLNLTDAELKELAMGAILHDIGKCKIPLDILNKPSKLSDDEFFVMRNHTILGMEIIDQTPDMTKRISNIVCQHHEKWDGTGYPIGLKSYDINKFSRIVAIADVYDALTANRVYRKRYMPHEAAEYLMAQADFQFDPDILRVFMENITVYPEGVIVMLNSGEIARVLNSKGAISIRPKVLVITRKDGPPILSPYELDLARNPTVFIVDMVT